MPSAILHPEFSVLNVDVPSGTDADIFLESKMNYIYHIDYNPQAQNISMVFFFTTNLQIFMSFLDCFDGWEQLAEYEIDISQF